MADLVSRPFPSVGPGREGRNSHIFIKTLSDISQNRGSPTGRSPVDCASPYVPF